MEFGILERIEFKLDQILKHSHIDLSREDAQVKTLTQESATETAAVQAEIQKIPLEAAIPSQQ